MTISVWPLTRENGGVEKLGCVEENSVETYKKFILVFEESLLNGWPQKESP